MYWNKHAIGTWMSHLRDSAVFLVAAALCPACGSPSGGKPDAVVRTQADGAPDLRQGSANDLAQASPEGAMDLRPEAAPDLSQETTPDGDGSEDADAAVCCPVSGMPSCEYAIGGTRSQFGVCAISFDDYPVAFEIRKDANGCDIVVQIGTEVHHCNVPPVPEPSRDASLPETADSDTSDR